MTVTNEGFSSPFDNDFNAIPGSLASRRKNIPIEEALKRVPLVYACCDIISAAISTVPVLLLKKGSRSGSEKAFEHLKGLKGLRYSEKGVDSQWLLERQKGIKRMRDQGLIEEVESNHPVHQLLDIPNLYEMNSFEDLGYLTMINPLIFGEYFWLLSEFKRGKPTKVETETTFHMRHIVKNGKLDHWNRMVVTDKYKVKFEEWPPENVVQFKLPNAYHRFRGLSPLLAGRLTVDQFINIAVWNSAQFKAGVKPPMAIETDRVIHGAQYDAWIAQILKRFTGFLKGQWPLILTRGAKAKMLFDKRELDFLKTLELNKEEIAQLYHVPPALVGIFRYANYANARMQKEVFWELGNLPRMLWFQRTIQNNLLSPYFPDIVFEWEWESVKALAPSSLERTKAQWQESETVKNYWEMGLDFDKIAEIVGNPLLKGSDSMPKDEGENTLFIEKYYLEPVNEGKNIKYEASEGFYETLVRNYFRHFLAPAGSRFTTHFKGFLQEMTENVINYSKPLNEQTWRKNWSDLTKDLVRNNLFRGINSVYTEVFSPENAIISPVMRDFSHLKAQFNENQHTKIEEIVENLSMIDGFIAPVVNGFNRVITDFLSDSCGKSLKKQVKMEQEQLFMKYGKRFGVFQAGLSYNVGRFLAMKQLGVLQHKWINGKCLKHQKANGQEVEFGKPFPFLNVLFPYDPHEKVEECSCLTVATLVKKPESVFLPISTENEVVEDAYDVQIGEKPYPNEHACRIRESIKGAPTKRKNNARKHDGKYYDIIYQKQKGSWVEQAYHYKKSIWTAAQARSHCKSHSGRFEAARSKCLTCGD